MFNFQSKSTILKKSKKYILHNNNAEKLSTNCKKHNCPLNNKVIYPLFHFKLIYWFFGRGSKFLGSEKSGEGRNFERPNVEGPIFRNLKASNLKNYVRSSYSIFLFKIYFSFFFNYLKTRIFYNFPNLLFWIFCKYFKFVNFANLKIL